MLTHRQMTLLRFIDKRIKESGIPPSYDEMAEALKMRSKSGAHQLVRALQERGYIRRLSNRARAIEVLKVPMNRESGPNAIFVSNDDDSQRLPVMGRIAAGVPVEAISSVTHHIVVPGQMLAPGETHFALEVKGDSMQNIGIIDGDTVILRKTDHPHDGDIVVALVEGQEATLKRFLRRGKNVALEAANPNYETRTYPGELVQVQGRLVGLLRNY